MLDFFYSKSHYAPDEAKNITT